MLVSVAEAARRLGIPATTLRRWARKGYIPAQRVGRTWAVDPAQVKSLLRAGLLPPRPGRIARWRKRLLELGGGVVVDPKAAEQRLLQALAEGDREMVLAALADVVFCSAQRNDLASARKAAKEAGLDFDTAVEVAVAKYEARICNVREEADVRGQEANVR